MTIQVQWDDLQQTTIRYDIPAGWTWQDLYQARQTVYDWMDTAEAETIYSIANFTDGKVSIPRDLMGHFDELTQYSHPKAGLMVVVGAGRVMRAVFGGLRKLFVTTTGRPLDFAYAPSLTAARATLDKVRLQ
jgi:hypothetical protein